MILDIFAGPGGWDVGLHLLGRSDVIGLELDEAACRTRRAAGLRTVRCDVAAQDLARWERWSIEGLIASPPCKAFSKAGKREGIEHVGALMEAIDREDWAARPSADPLVWLVLEVGRWAAALQPRWIACEQVPEVLPLWRQYRGVLERWGFSAWCGILTAEQYGVPQTRERSFLIASQDRRVGPPAPTHQRWESRNSHGGTISMLLPPVSMAEALGWAVETQAGFPRLDDRGDSEDGYRERDWREGGAPAFAVTEKARSWTVRGSNARPNATERSPDEPAPTIAFGHAGPEVVLNTGLDWKAGGDRDDAQKIPASSLAPALTEKSGGQWQFSRPATTVAGDSRLWPPGHKENSSDPPGRYQQRRGEQAEKLSIGDALVLQSFSRDYPVQGTKTKQFEQVGNAVPPLLAAHVLASALGAPWPA